MRRFAFLICLLLATGCAEKSPTGPTVPLDERFTLAPRQIAAIEGADVRVLFVGVTGDSRCPGDAICIQGGDAIVHVRIAVGDGSGSPFELHTGDESRAEVSSAGVRVRLEELQPYPFSSLGPIQQAEYRATLRVTRP